MKTIRRRGGNRLKVKNLINSILLGEEDEKGLKLYYKTDIFIQDFPEEEEEEEEEPEAPVTAQEPAPAAQPAGLPPDIESTEESGNLLAEDIYKVKTEGEEVLPKEEADNIQTLEDLVDYVSDLKENGKPVMSEVAKEIVLTLAGLGQDALDDLVNEGDKVIVDIDYGTDIEDSIGLRVNKVPGSNSISISMKKNSKIIPGNFDLASFNRQLVFFRNSLFGA